MAILTYKPTTPGRRGMTTRDTAALTGRRPTKTLLEPARPASGRNNQGKITVRHRGGGVKRFYRRVDLNFQSGKGVVRSIEYDPNRSAYIALVELDDGTKMYLLASGDLKVGAKVESAPEAAIRPANRLPLRNIPVGSAIHNIELVVGHGGALARSAGARAQLAGKEGEYAQVKLPSGELRLVDLDCLASIGGVGNEAHQNIKWGKAGRRRRLGWRPQVLGKSMNPIDHPHGGGEAHNSIGLRKGPKTPWGKVALGLKTRNRRATDNMIIRSRSAGRRG